MALLFSADIDMSPFMLCVPIADRWRHLVTSLTLLRTLRISMEQLADDPPAPIDLEQLEEIRKVVLVIAIHRHLHRCGIADHRNRSDGAGIGLAYRPSLRRRRCAGNVIVQPLDRRDEEILALVAKHRGLRMKGLLHGLKIAILDTVDIQIDDLADAC